MAGSVLILAAPHLVIVEGDPHADIRALRAVQAVYLNGQAVAQLAA